MDGLNVGTLTGGIELDDTFSSSLGIAQQKVIEFGKQFLETLGDVGIAAGVALTAVSALTAGVIELGSHGSDINDVTSGIDRMAGSLENADAIISAMSAGVAGTVDNLTACNVAGMIANHIEREFRKPVSERHAVCGLRLALNVIAEYTEA